MPSIALAVACAVGDFIPPDREGRGRGGEIQRVLHSVEDALGFYALVDSDTRSALGFYALVDSDTRSAAQTSFSSLPFSRHLAWSQICWAAGASPAALMRVAPLLFFSSR
jgi:hypothetical protein